MYMTNYFYHYETAKKMALSLRNWDGRSRWVYVFDRSSFNTNIKPGPDPKPQFFITMQEPNPILGTIPLLKADGPMSALGVLIMYWGNVLKPLRIKFDESDDPTELDWMFQNLEAMPLERIA